MRIITGFLKGRKIELPPDVTNVRPTSDRTKEGMFSVIAARKNFDGLRVLDLFGGSGNLGLEAISRGAGSVFFVDNSRDVIRYIRNNAEKLGVDDKIRCQCSDVTRFINGPARPYDLVFADPPYDYPAMKELVERIVSEGWLEKDGWLILEHDSRHNFTEHPHCAFSKPYGRTIVTIFVGYAVYQPEPPKGTNP